MGAIAGRFFITSYSYVRWHEDFHHHFKIVVSNHLLILPGRFLPAELFPWLTVPSMMLLVGINLTTLHHRLSKHLSSIFMSPLTLRPAHILRYCTCTFQSTGCPNICPPYSCHHRHCVLPVIVHVHLNRHVVSKTLCLQKEFVKNYYNSVKAQLMLLHSLNG